MLLVTSLTKPAPKSDPTQQKYERFCMQQQADQRATSLLPLTLQRRKKDYNFNGMEEYLHGKNRRGNLGSLTLQEHLSTENDTFQKKRRRRNSYLPLLVVTKRQTTQHVKVVYNRQRKENERQFDAH